MHQKISELKVPDPFELEGNETPKTPRKEFRYSYCKKTDDIPQSPPAFRNKKGSANLRSR